MISGSQRAELSSHCNCLCLGHSAVSDRKIETASEDVASAEHLGTVPGKRRTDSRVIAYPYEPGLGCRCRVGRGDDDCGRPADAWPGLEVAGPGDPGRNAAMDLDLTSRLGCEDLHVLASWKTPEETAVATANAAFASRGAKRRACVGSKAG